ncbi:MAG TPA: hypothetical protein PKM58_10970, partial [Pyrinomonadaceae bacterium]|nr:hypothetical protein [Pyrinomonadaceae bacterium]
IADTAARTLEMEPPIESYYDYGDAGTDDEMIEASPAGGVVAETSEETVEEAAPEAAAPEDGDDFGKTQPLSHEELKDFAFVESEPLMPTSVPESTASTVESAAPVSIDESNPLDLPPLVEETGIRASYGFVEPESPAPVVEQPRISEELVVEITARVADKLMERVARAFDGDVVREVAEEVLREIGHEEAAN